MEARNTDTMKVQLFISCRKLKDVETFSKSDPFVEVFQRSATSQWTKVGQTEVIWDNLNPDFIKSFILDYHFEEQLYLFFKVFDANIENGREVKGLQLGEVESTLSEIVGSKGQQIIKTLHMPGSVGSCGNIVVRVEEISTVNNDEIQITFRGRGLPNMGCWYKFHSFKPMFYLSRAWENKSNQRIYCSEASSGVNPTWLKVVKSMQELCNGDSDRPIIFELYDHHRSGKHTPVGKFEFSIRMIREEGKKSFELMDPQGKKKNLGVIEIINIQHTPVYSFLDYIAGGCQINLLIAVDFTGSNGHPLAPTSLHFISPNGYNHYQSALHSVSDILLNYDSDKEVPLYGFGGKINRQVSHCFPLNFDANNPAVTGLKGIMEGYKQALHSVELSGPTLFSHVIRTAVMMAEHAQVNQFNQQYFILLILTDGEIHDMNETIDWIVRGSNAPLSIVIVGIGNDSFQNMDRLDADDEPLIDSRGVKMTRDIVQFVPYRNFNNSPSALTKEVLAEIPREITNFFKIKKIQPNSAIEAPAFDFQRSYTVDSSGYTTTGPTAANYVPEILVSANPYSSFQPVNPSGNLPPYNPPNNGGMYYSYNPPKGY
jgi:hypothetical protein